MDTFTPPKGMRDFYPEEYRAREALFSAWRATAAAFGFEMYDACVIESLELLERKAGEEISEQIYAFEDKSHNRLALRPELTPSLARMIIARQGGLTFPLKWSAVAQCFRYERMQRGRKREHYQWNLDIVGEESVMAEAEVIGAAVTALRRLGLSAQDFQVRVGSRALLSALLAQSGIAPEHYAACYLALDKRGKISDADVAALLRSEGLAEQAVQSVFTLIALTSIDQVAAHIADVHNPAATAALADLQTLFAHAEALGFLEFLSFDLAVIRGLGYYTGIVFEAFDTAGKFRAIFGGGRYDSLLSALGGQKMPCVGLGFGDVVVMELLADSNHAPQTSRQLDLAVGYMEAAAAPLALQIVAKMRAGGQSVDLALRPERAKKFFDRANKACATQAIYLGPDEVAKGEFTLKAMSGGTTRTATLDSL
jgi:histidyl-tRNA synthetase